jgi:hypothetical protein
MSSVPSIHEGNLAARPSIPHSGAVRGFRQAGTSCADATDSPETAAQAELNGLISSLGSLSAQAQGLPLSPPTLPGLPQGQGYQPQATDYTQFADDSN